MKNSNRDLRTTTIFFILAFTFAFFTFSIGNSALNAQKKKLERLDNKKNKIVNLETEKTITSNDLINLLEKEDITIQLEKEVNVQEDRSKNYAITTEIKSDGFSRMEDLRYGEYLSNVEYKGEEYIGVFSNSISDDKSFKIKYMSQNGEEILTINEVGRTFETERKIDVPNEVFFKTIGGNSISGPMINIILSGKEDELNKSLDKIKEYLSKIDTSGKVNVRATAIVDISKQAKQMFIASILIVAITIVNSVSIASLWIDDKRKELVIRKVCGAKDINLAKIFLGRLFIVSITSVLIAIIMQWGVGVVFKGVFLNMDIRISLNNVLYSFALSVGVAFLASLPALKYISEIQPTEMLRGE